MTLGASPLLKKGMAMTEEPAYLGDGLYATNDGFGITLSALREEGTHYVYLEPDVFDALIQYAKEIGMLKKGAER